MALIAGAWVLSASSLAAANNYHVFMCRIPYGPQAGRPAPVENMSYVTNGNYMYVGDSCAVGGSLYTTMDGEVPHPYASGAIDTFTAPAGMTIAGFTIWRYEADTEAQVYGAPASNLAYLPGQPSVQGICARSLGCSSRGTPAEPLAAENAVTVPGLGGVTEIQWSAECGGGEGGVCPASGSSTPSSQYNIYAADIDLVDNTPPTVSNVSGPLVAGDTLTGNRSISFSASDDQSGVYDGSLIVDGHTAVSQTLDTNEGHCQSLGLTGDGQRSFEYAQPCKSSVSASLTLDTSELAAGEHSLELIVEDAAGNQTIAYDGTITVAGASSTANPPASTNEPGTPSTSTNTATTAGTPGAATPSSNTTGTQSTSPGPPNGTNASDQAVLTAHWTRTSGPALTTRYGEDKRITGHLTTPSGQPITDASIDALETPAYGSAHTQTLPNPHTGPHGEWSLTLPTSTPSSSLRFNYLSHLNNTTPTATTSLTLRVHAGIALGITPRITRVGQRIYFTGIIHGPIPPGGKQLILEASSGGGWIQFDTVRTNPQGHYHASYRFKFPGPVTYRFRAVSLFEADFPFLGGTSNGVAVREV